MKIIPDLFKYMKSDRLFKLIENKSIRFTQPKFLNDPYESHLTLDRKTMLKHFLDSQEERTSNLSNREKISLFKRNEQSLIEIMLERYRFYRDDLCILSLTEDPFNLLLWAHYGDEHKGVAVSFDIGHPSLRVGSNGGNELSTIEQIVYQESKVKGIPLPETMTKVLSTKSLDWSYEKEWRLIRTKNKLIHSHDEIYIVNNLDLTAIKEIYLGAHFSNENFGKLKEILNKPEGQHIIIKKLTLSPNKFKLRAVDLGKYAWTLLHRSHHFGEYAEEALEIIPMRQDLRE